MAQKARFLRNPESAMMSQILDSIVRKIDSGEWTTERALRVLNNISASRRLKMVYKPGYLNQHRKYRDDGHLVRAPRSEAIKTVA